MSLTSKQVDLEMPYCDVLGEDVRLRSVNPHGNLHSYLNLQSHTFVDFRLQSMNDVECELGATVRVS